MITYVYRSPKKDEMYLYLSERDQFESLGEDLRKVFGEPQFVMMLNLDNRDKLARVNIERVKQELTVNGYFLQLPPKIEPLQADVSH